MAYFQGRPVKSNFFLPLYLLLTLLSDHACADPPYKLCPTTTNYTKDSQFQKNLNHLLQSLSSNAASSKFYKTTTGTDVSDEVYGAYMCLNYVSNHTCHDCITTASEAIVSLCENVKEAVVWEEVCQLRYSNDNFFGQLNVSDSIPIANKLNTSEPEKFKTVVNQTLHNLTKLAVFNLSENMYATGRVPYNDRTIYGLVQCTNDLSADECNICLERALKDTLDMYYFSMGARLLSRSCYLRYEFYEFYTGATSEVPTDSTSPPNSSKGGEDRGGKMQKIIVITASVLAFLALVILGSCLYYRAVYKKNRTRNTDGTVGQQMANNKNFQRRNVDTKAYFDLASIQAATNNFSDLNMLGKGGFGPVYKGTLGDGKEMAVKRLSSCSEQGSEEFVNEVLLIMKLQHKNLVRLLGFCVDQDEKLLVYEFMPNSSLDVILFDPMKRTELSWRVRVNIIWGIAKGILYLHEDSRLRIIHRDLKASNILLDCDMNPKISDFGMARIFVGSEGEDSNTATVVGTYGYMAPEYAMEGIYSVKSDVYSYGVLLLEIITGTRNASFHLTRRGPSLLAYAWQLWNEGRGMEMMDPLLVVDSSDEFLRYLHVGLLCIQEDANDRPTMSSVAIMLRSSSESTTLSQPKQPAFFMGIFVDDQSPDADIFSANGLTLSNMVPR